VSAPAAARSQEPGASIGRRAAFDFIRYGNVWEDADVLCEALAPNAPGGRLCSIASAGDNVLALLTLDPVEVVAVDLSVAQLACLELRIATFRGLDHSERLAFLGVTPSQRRPETYRQLGRDLSPRAREFWDAHPEALAEGAIHAGKFERYFEVFRRFVLPLVHGRRTVEELLRAKSIEDQRRFYQGQWDSWRWRALFKVFFSRAVMGRLGRDPEFFAGVEGPVGERILERTHQALTELPVSTNPYVRFIVTGSFSPQALPRYLRPEHATAIRSRLDRVRLLQGTVQSAGGSFDGFNLSDIFEYMPTLEHETCYADILDHSRPGARLVYWNMLAPRARPSSLAARATPLDQEARALHARDRAWFYQRLHIDRVSGGRA
jgi:S-adenosylmethionine-diacylglycerol 3-amino-3-carboxypropyl transferase